MLKKSTRDYRLFINAEGMSRRVAQGGGGAAQILGCVSATSGNADSRACIITAAHDGSIGAVII